MSDTYTPNLNLTKPAVGGSRDTWGTKTNGDWDIVDGVFAAAGNGTSVGLNVGAGKTLSVAGTLTASGTVSLPAAATAGGATIVSTTGTQTLTNKTLTAPAIGGQASYAAGTVSAPSITFSGDTNTGIYSPAADTIAFTEGGVESMRIDASGRVGINTASPASPLEVSSTSQFSGIALTGTGRAWSVGSNSTAVVNVNYQHDAMAFTASGSERMRIDASGNVGIGTSSPARRLDIQQSGTNYQLRIGDAGGSNFYDIGRDTSNGLLTFYGSQSVASGYVFSTVNGERARITSGGQVFVNRASRQSGSVDVQGGIYCDALVSNYGIGSHSGVGGAYQNNAINFQWNGSAARLWVDTTDQGSISISSDYRVKKNVKTQTASALDRVQQIRPVTYTYADYEPFGWKADGVAREGFIAHELAEVIPSAVEGEKDEPHKVQSLKLDALCSVLVKAIQEQQAQIEELKARVAALENK